MESFVDFLLHYYREIILGIITIIQVVILVCKKVKINYELPASWYPALVDLVAEAEQVYGEGHGRQKLNYVVQKMRTKLNIKYNDGVIDFLVSEMVEKILSTPQKKGECDEKAK